MLEFEQRHHCIEARNALDRSDEIVQAVLGHDRRDLGTDAHIASRLVDDAQSAGLGDGSENGDDEYGDPFHEATPSALPGCATWFGIARSNRNGHTIYLLCTRATVGVATPIVTNARPE